jgi:hypothetical protein
MALTLTTLTADACERLGQVYTGKEVLDEVQAITGQLNEEVVPPKSIQKHIDLATLEVASLLNTVNAPFYGFRSELTFAGTGEGIKDIYGHVVTIDTFAVGIDKLLAITANAAPGVCKKCRDWSQYAGISQSSNTQWSNSIIWIHHGKNLYLWAGADITGITSLYVAGYRQPAPIGSGTFTWSNDTKVDLPDKYVSLVASKTALWAMKQSKMGNYEEVEGTVQNGVAMIQKEWETGIQASMVKSRNESLEGV